MRKYLILLFFLPSVAVAQPIRGIACLHCLHPNATKSRTEILSVLRQAGLQRVAINFLVDGSFGFNVTGLSDELAGIAPETHVIFYLTNGSSQRDCRRTKVAGVFTKICPKRFRELIKDNEGIRDIYRAVVRNLVPTIVQLNAQGATVYLVPGLEDNLTVAEVVEMYQLAEQELAGVPVRWIRNPCPGCYSGNDSVLPVGFLLERHNTHSGVVGGVISNDGEQLSVSGLKKWAKKSTVNNNMFLAWCAKRQGLGVRGSKRFTKIHPDKRKYQGVSGRAARDLISVLRAP